jgi:hypothetical protein
MFVSMLLHQNLLLIELMMEILYVELETQCGPCISKFLVQLHCKHNTANLVLCVCACAHSPPSRVFAQACSRFSSRHEVQGALGCTLYHLTHQ